MQTSTEQPFLPTAVNILRLRDYILPPDGVVLFDWFVVKQACFRSGSFHYSQARIQAETRIARHRQDSLITQFCEWDFLVVFVNFNPATGGRVRFFSLDYAALADPGVLTHVVRKDSDLFVHYLNYFTHMSARLNTPKASTPTPAEEQAQAERVYHLLNRTFNERRKFYNLGGLTQGVRPVQPLPPTELPRNRAFVPRLARLGRQYSDDAICNSFGSYTDSLILGQKKVRSPPALLPLLRRPLRDLRRGRHVPRHLQRRLHGTPPLTPGRPFVRTGKLYVRSGKCIRTPGHAPCPDRHTKGTYNK